MESILFLLFLQFYNISPDSSGLIKQIKTFFSQNSIIHRLLEMINKMSDRIDIFAVSLNKFQKLLKLYYYNLNLIGLKYLLL